MIDRIILNNYNIEVSKIEKLHKGFVCDKWIVYSEKQKYVFKQMQVSDVKRIKFINLVQERLSQKLLAPKIIKTMSNMSYCESDEIFYILYEYIETIENIVVEPYDMGAFLAILHNEMQQINLLELSDLNCICLKVEQSHINEIINLLKFYNEGDVEFTILNAKMDKLYQYQFDDAIKDLSKGIIHGDFYMDNILYNNRKNVIIDFDQCCYFYREYELFRAMMKLFYNSGDTCIDNLNRFSQFILGYLSHNNISTDSLLKGLGLYLYMQLNDLYCLRPIDYKILNHRNYAVKRYEDLVWLLDNKKRIAEKIKSIRREIK